MPSLLASPTGWSWHHDDIKILQLETQLLFKEITVVIFQKDLRETPSLFSIHALNRRTQPLWRENNPTLRYHDFLRAWPSQFSNGMRKWEVLFFFCISPPCSSPHRVELNFIMMISEKKSTLIGWPPRVFIEFEEGGLHLHPRTLSTLNGNAVENSNQIQPTKNKTYLQKSQTRSHSFHPCA